MIKKYVHVLSVIRHIYFYFYNICMHTLCCKKLSTVLIGTLFMRFQIICCHMIQFAELALSYDLLLHGRTVIYLYYLAVSHYQQGRYTSSLVHIEEALKLSWEVSLSSMVKSHLIKPNKNKGYTHYSLGLCQS